MAGIVVVSQKMGGGLFFSLLMIAITIFASSATASLLPPRLSAKEHEVHLKEGQTGAMLECTVDIGDDPIAFRWLKNHQWVTGSLGFAYRGYRQILLALHTVKKHHEGTYVCEASNDAGVHSFAIKVFVENGDLMPPESKHLRTEEILGDIATSLNDVLAEGDCNCDALFFIHASPDAPVETVAAQANLVHTIADSIVSESTRISVMTYSDYADTKISFGKGTNRCALREAFSDLDKHKKWATRLQPVLREAFKKMKKSNSNCKLLFLPIFGSIGIEGADIIGANHLKKAGVKMFIFEVTDDPIENVRNMASKRGDGLPFHWRVPLRIWPTIVMYMKYMTEELGGCMTESIDIPGKCVGINQECTSDKMCDGAGHGCIDGKCQPLECNIDSSTSGCCNKTGHYWCGDVTKQCTDSTSICDGKVQCMNGADEDRCWSEPCPKDKVAKCQSSTLCLDRMDLCDGEPACPGGEDEDPRFCRAFPCPVNRPFRCRSGNCIESKGLCDGKFKDCEDGEDEDLDYCSRIHVCPGPNPFKCDYGICIAEEMLCDGPYNCLDASDELECEKRSCPADRPYKCSSGLCISMDMVCNGVIDGCDDGSDESNCTETVCPFNRNLKCNNGRCIDGWLRCDGNNDCTDGSDELNCQPKVPSTTTERQPSCPQGQFSCDNGACIPDRKVCDGRRHCVNGEDEEGCKVRPCPSDRPHRCGDGTCIITAPPCDGIEHCSDGSDEINCTHTEEETHIEKEDYYNYDYDDEDDEDRIPLPVPGTEEEVEDYSNYDGHEDKGMEDDVKEEDGTMVEEGTLFEGETLAEESVIAEEPAEDTPMHKDDMTEDIEGMETMLESPEPSDVRPPEASSKEGASAGHCAMPLSSFIMTCLLMLNLRYVWMR